MPELKKPPETIVIMGTKYKLDYSHDLGEEVICDFCNKSWEDTDEEGNLLTGGYILGTTAVCPDCAVPNLDTSEMDVYELKTTYICPKEISFWKFVMKFRDGNNFCSLYTEVKDEGKT